MGRDTTMIALDSNAMTYWIDAMKSVSGPPADPCGTEKIALARIFFGMPDGSGFNLTPTVEAEYRAIRNCARLDDHVRWALALLCPVRPAPDSEEVEARANELVKFHKDIDDCRIVAECELTEILTLLTCDAPLLDNLGAEARGVQLCLPTEYWARLSERKGARPIRVPHDTNPMSRCGWWRW